MSDLHYMAMETLGDWSRSQGTIRFQSRPYSSYLWQARRALESQKLRLRWSAAPPEVVESLDKTLVGRGASRPRQKRKGRRRSVALPGKGIPTGTWVILEALSPEDPQATFDSFLEAESIYDDFDCKRSSQIKILAADEERQALLLERVPTLWEPGERPPRGLPDALKVESAIPLLFLKPNVYPLRCQENALTRLVRTPTRGLEPLVRLLSGFAQWPAFTPEPIDEEDWCILTDPLRSGTPEQRDFVERALASPDLTLLEGPPGSGKTTAICELILQSAKRGERVLLVASTHVAVDNVLERLIEWKDQPDHPDLVLPVRVGSSENVTSDLARPYQLQTCLRQYQADLKAFLEDPRGTDPDADPARARLAEAMEGDKEGLLRLLLDSANLVCGTTIGILQHPAIKGSFLQEPFDLMIIDEASKTPFTEFLVPAVHARKWVVVGDIRQLAPYVDEGDLSENLKALLPARDAEICTDVFAATQDPRRAGRSTLVSTADPELADKYRTQARALGVPFADLDQDLGHELLYATLVVGSPAALKAQEGRIPADLQLFRGDPAALPAWLRHRRALKQEPLLSEGDLEPWEKQLAWRIIRSYELRQVPEERERYLKAIRDLLPQWRAGATRKGTEGDLMNLRRVALPSILELLQVGFERHEDQRSRVALTDGLHPGDLRPRLVSLSYQHRMHPELSAFPRSAFYRQEEGSALLNDAEGMAARREWAYPRYAARAVWVTVEGAKGREAGGRNANPQEVEKTLEELEAFVAWAGEHPRGGAESGPWEVAILTFYRGQEALFKQKLRALTGLSGHTRSFFLPRGARERAAVRITLCTVDRFQGHEADVVFLSFVKTRTLGFLNSPNRLNVALTRARHQLVLVGNRAFFAGERRGRTTELLKALATEIPADLHYAREDR